MKPALRTALAVTATTGFVLTAAATASAHVQVSAPGAARGGDAVLTFLVPNESGTNSPTTALSVRFPSLVEVDTQAVPGWKSTVIRDAAEHVTEVTWTADPGAGIFPGQFGQFQVLADGLPDTPTVTFPATQTYSDGEVVRWEQPQNKNGTDPERPVPTLVLAAKEGMDVARATAATSVIDRTDDVARWLGGAGIGLAVFALGGVAGLTLSRRG